MVERREYEPSSRLRDIIKANRSVLMVMSRFGISLGFGNKTIKEICEHQDVDTNTFLAVINFLCFKKCNTNIGYLDKK